MDLEVEIKRALIAKEDRRRKKHCTVIGCRSVKRTGSNYCVGHYKSYKLGLIEGVVPLNMKDQFKQSVSLVRNTLNDVKLGHVTLENAKEIVFAGVSQLLAGPTQKGTLNETTFLRVESVSATPKFIKMRQDAKKLKALNKATRLALHLVPIEFQVSRVIDDGDVLSVTMGTPVNVEVDGELGYKDSESDLFVPKEQIKAVFNNAFSKGNKVQVYVNRK